mgnify:FL=1
MDFLKVLYREKVLNPDYAETYKPYAGNIDLRDLLYKPSDYEGSGTWNPIYIYQGDRDVYTQASLLDKVNQFLSTI